MKKFLVTILALAYLATTTGATLHMHYCMGKMYSVDLVKEDGCSKCGMETSNGCCNDELKVLKVEDDHQAISYNLNFESSFEALPAKYNIIDPVLNYVAPSLATNNNSPPRSPANSLCILYSVFRI